MIWKTKYIFTSNEIFLFLLFFFLLIRIIQFIKILDKYL